MSARAVLRTCLIAVVAAMLAAPLGLQQGYTDQACPVGTERVVNTGDCVVGPSGNITRNKVGKLMDISKCATYPGREYDEVVAHKNNPLAANAAAQFNVSNDHDYGNIASIVDGGNCVFQDQLGTRIDAVCVIKQFYVTHQDVYDYVGIFPEFNHAEGSYHNWVKTNTGGLNIPLLDNSATFGTQNLKSFLLYRNYMIMPDNPFDRINNPAPNNDSPMSLIAQEASHRFGAYIRRDKDPGPRIRAATDLLGRNLAHWCFYVDGPSNTTNPDPNRPGFSSLEGNRWLEITPGTFRTSLKSDGFSKIDQYLWGFRAPGNVGTFYRLDTGNGNPNPDCAHQPYTPQTDTPWTFTLPKINVAIDDIIRVEGSRNPDAQSSQKNWRMAFILLTKVGVIPTTTEINKLNLFRTTWSGTTDGQGYFRDESGGGKMFSTLGPVDMDLDGYASNLDCNEQDTAVHPGATEICNGVDDDCDGIIDDGFDNDGDLYTTCNGDCNDANAAVNPGRTETWNGVDDNCDGVIDNVNLVDADGDGYFVNPQNTQQADCNDANAAINPGAAEIVDGIDNNCNGFVDCSDPTVVKQSENGSRAHDGLDNNCDGIIDG